MSDEKKIQNEEELWDLLREPVSETPKAEAPKPAKPEPAPKSAKRIDGFFLTCMAGVAAVSVAATLLVSGMLGGSGSKPIYNGANVPNDSSVNEVLEQQNTELKLQNAELRAQLEQQKKQIKDLQDDLITLMGSEEFFATAPSNPDEGNEVLSSQMEAMAIYAAIQEAYADFDREKLEELIPQMDEMLSYLTPEMLNNYYLILEYVEQPSNG